MVRWRSPQGVWSKCSERRLLQTQSPGGTYCKGTLGFMKQQRIKSQQHGQTVRIHFSMNELDRTSTQALNLKPRAFSTLYLMCKLTYCMCVCSCSCSGTNWNRSSCPRSAWILCCSRRWRNPESWGRSAHNHVFPRHTGQWLKYTQRPCDLITGLWFEELILKRI